METKELSIEGMTCMHCVMSVKEELGKIAGVTVENVEMGKAKIKYDSSAIAQEVIKNAVEEAGYKLTSVH